MDTRFLSRGKPPTTPSANWAGRRAAKMLKDEGVKEPPEEFVVFPSMTAEQRKRIYNVLDRSIDVFLEKIASGDYDEEYDD